MDLTEIFYSKPSTMSAFKVYRTNEKNTKALYNGRGSGIGENLLSGLVLAGMYGSMQLLKQKPK